MLPSFLVRSKLYESRKCTDILQKSSFKGVTSQFELSIANNRGSVRIQDPLLFPPIPMSSPLRQAFVPLNKLSRDLLETDINVLCMVGKVYPEKTFPTEKSSGVLTKQDAVCFDEEGPNILLTLWELKVSILICSWGDDCSIASGIEIHSDVCFFENVTVKEYKGMPVRYYWISVLQASCNLGFQSSLYSTQIPIWQQVENYMLGSKRTNLLSKTSAVLYIESDE